MPHEVYAESEGILFAMATAAQEVGRLLVAGPPPGPFIAFDEFVEIYGALEARMVAAIRPHLEALRPGVPWLEELDSHAVVPQDGEVWVVDVVDGAVQYLQDLPQFCVSLALVRDAEPVAAVLHSPLLGQTYTAARGHGATRDGRPIAPSAKTDPAASLVATSQPPFIARQPDAAAEAGRSLAALLPHVGAVRNLGPTSWQIADVAAGRIDAFWEFGRDDTNLLPGTLIAREAGVLVTDADGQPWRPGADSFLAAPAALHEQLLQVFTRRR